MRPSRHFLAAALLAGIAVACADDTTSTPTAPPTTTPSSTSAPPTTAAPASTATVAPSTAPGPSGTLTVHLEGLEVVPGDTVAGVLYADGDSGRDTNWEAVGGFAVAADSTTVTATQTVTTGRPDGDFSGLFPFVTDEPARLPAGVYSLSMWVGQNLGPYARWVPGAVDGLRGCWTPLVIDVGEQAQLTLTAVPAGPTITEAESMVWHDPDMPCVISAGTVAMVRLGEPVLLAGGEVAGVLSRGDRAFQPDPGVVGGFGIELTASGADSQYLRVGLPDGDLTGPFPFVSDVPVLLEPGTYVLAMWAADRLAPYSHWVPASAPTLRGCQVPITVVAGQPTIIRIEEIPAWTESSAAGNVPTCPGDRG